VVGRARACAQARSAGMRRRLGLVLEQVGKNGIVHCIEYASAM
jgi:hypothetical protein